MKSVLKRRWFQMLTLCCMLIAVACSKKEKEEGGATSVVSITTSSFEEIGEDYAIGGGVIADGGDKSVRTAGLCWSITPEPTISNSKESTDKKTGSFTVRISPLSPKTTYYVRAYVQPTIGEMIYGNSVQFTTRSVSKKYYKLSGKITSGVTALEDANIYLLKKEEIDSRALVAQADSLAASKTVAESSLKMDTLTTRADNASYRTTSKSDGVYEFTSVEEGSYYVQVVRDGYLSHYQTIEVKAAMERNFDLSAYGDAKEKCWYTEDKMDVDQYGSDKGEFLAAVNWLPTDLKECEYYTVKSVTYFPLDQADYTLYVYVGNELAGTYTLKSVVGQKNVFDLSAYKINIDREKEVKVVIRAKHSVGVKPLGYNRSATIGDGKGNLVSTDDGITWSTLKDAGLKGNWLIGILLEPETGVSVPVVTTGEVTDVTISSAVCKGNVTSDGGATVTERGFCYATTSKPTITSQKVEAGNGKGSFNATLTDLKPSTVYYVRAYAKNRIGVAYGAQQSFTTKGEALSKLTGKITSLTNNAISGATVKIRKYAELTEDHSVAPQVSSSPVGSLVNTNEVTGINLLSITGNKGGKQSPMTKTLEREYTATSLSDGSYIFTDIEPGYYDVRVENSNYLSFYTVAMCNPGEQTMNITLLSAAGLVNKQWFKNNVGTTIVGRESAGDYYASVKWDASDLADCPGYEIKYVSINPGMKTDYTLMVYVDGQLKTTKKLVDYNVLETNYFDLEEEHVSIGTGKKVQIVVKAVQKDKEYPFVTDGKGPAENNKGNLSSFDGTTWGSILDSDGIKGNWHISMVLKAGAVQLPTVSTTAVSEVTETSAKCESAVNSDGGGAILERGICYSTNTNPTVTSKKVECGEGMGSFNATLSDLSPATTYYVRAYARNSAGVAYGEQISFTTLKAPEKTSLTGKVVSNTNKAISQATVTIVKISDLTTTSAAPPVTRKLSTGYSQVVTSNAPVTSARFAVGRSAMVSSRVASGKEITATTTSDGSFRFDDLEPGIYDFRIAKNGYISQYVAYSLEAGDLSLSSNIVLVSVEGMVLKQWFKPNVITSSVGGVDYNGDYYAAVEWESSDLTDCRNYDIKYITFNPASETDYSFDVYINDAIKYSDKVTKHTCWSTNVFDVEGENINIGSGNKVRIVFKALQKGDDYPFVTDGSGPAVNNKGNLVSRDGTNWSTLLNNGDLQCNWQISMALIPGKVQAPTVTTGTVSDITENSASCSGNVTDDGGGNVTERGICYSTSYNPTIASSHVASGSGLGSFSATITDLSPNRTYYVRAYAKNSAGVAYGESKTFTTLEATPKMSFSGKIVTSSGSVLSGAQVTILKIAEATANIPVASLSDRGANELKKTVKTSLPLFTSAGTKASVSRSSIRLRTRAAGTEYSRTTANDGTFSFTNMEPGIYDIRVSKNGYITEYCSYSLPAGEWEPKKDIALWSTSGMVIKQWFKQNVATSIVGSVDHTGDYYAAAEWEGTDLTNCRNYKIKYITFNPGEDTKYYCYIYVDGKEVLAVELTECQKFHTNIFDLEERNINIGSGKKVRIVLKAIQEKGGYPFVTDDYGPANSKGNLVSYDGETWNRLTDSNLDCNWHISVVLKP